MPIRLGQMTLQTMTLQTSELSPFYFIKRIEFDFVTIVCRPTGSASWGRSTPVGETRARCTVRRRQPLDRGPVVHRRVSGPLAAHTFDVTTARVPAPAREATGCRLENNWNV